MSKKRRILGYKSRRERRRVFNGVVLELERQTGKQLSRNQRNTVRANVAQGYGTVLSDRQGYGRTRGGGVRYRNPLVKEHLNDVADPEHRWYYANNSGIGKALTKNFLTRALLKDISLHNSPGFDSEPIDQDEEIRTALVLIEADDYFKRAGLRQMAHGWQFLVPDVEQVNPNDQNSNIDIDLQKVYGQHEVPLEQLRRANLVDVDMNKQLRADNPGANISTIRLNDVLEYRVSFIPELPMWQLRVNLHSVIDTYNKSQVHHTTNGPWNYGVGESVFEGIWDTMVKLTEQSENNHFRSGIWAQVFLNPDWNEDEAAQYVSQATYALNNKQILASYPYIDEQSGTLMESIPRLQFSNTVDAGNPSRSREGVGGLLESEWVFLCLETGYSIRFFTGNPGGALAAATEDTLADIKNDIARFSNIAKYLIKPFLLLLQSYRIIDQNLDLNTVFIKSWWEVELDAKTKRELEAEDMKNNPEGGLAEANGEKKDSKSSSNQSGGDTSSSSTKKKDDDKSKVQKERLRNQVMKMRQDGLSVKEIAAKLGISEAQVRAILSAAGRKNFDTIEESFLYPNGVYVKVAPTAETRAALQSYQTRYLQQFDLNLDLHCTLIYSKKPSNEYIEIESDHKEAYFDKFAVFGKALVVVLDSNDLTWRNHSLTYRYEFIADFKHYRPHITLVYGIDKSFDISSLPAINFKLEFQHEYVEDLDDEKQNSHVDDNREVVIAALELASSPERGTEPRDQQEKSHDETYTRGIGGQISEGDIATSINKDYGHLLPNPWEYFTQETRNEFVELAYHDHNNLVQETLALCIKHNISMPLVPVASSTVKAVGLKDENIFVQFHPGKGQAGTGGRYKYELGDQSTAETKWRELIQSTSKGGYVWDNFRGDTIGPAWGTGNPTPGGTSASLVPYEKVGRISLPKLTPDFATFERTAQELRDFKMEEFGTERAFEPSQLAPSLGGPAEKFQPSPFHTEESGFGFPHRHPSSLVPEAFEGTPERTGKKGRPRKGKTGFQVQAATVKELIPAIQAETAKIPGGIAGFEASSTPAVAPTTGPSGSVSVPSAGTRSTAIADLSLLFQGLRTNDLPPELSENNYKYWYGSVTNAVKVLHKSKTTLYKRLDVPVDVVRRNRHTSKLEKEDDEWWYFVTNGFSTKNQFKYMVDGRIQVEYQCKEDIRANVGVTVPFAIYHNRDDPDLVTVPDWQVVGEYTMIAFDDPSGEDISAYKVNKAATREVFERLNEVDWVTPMIEAGKVPDISTAYPARVIWNKEHKVFIQKDMRLTSVSFVKRGNCSAPFCTSEVVKINAALKDCILTHLNEVRAELDQVGAKYTHNELVRATMGRCNEQIVAKANEIIDARQVGDEDNV